ncbi:DUF4062 domain-containing protein [Methylobacter sp.]|uniref:DUF4062 domain-containing protein n=1 Tax=Methylobacter sp. TaxID=2051955 RepID=UPI0025CC1C34|nr:DUF4062 domain-containing protein [Methylobacter sp.]
MSSTYYDLKHVQSSFDNFIKSLGYDFILSKKGDISYSPDVPFSESFCREFANADIFLLIIGGRYGSATSTDNKKQERTFCYDNMTKKEYESACSRNIPVYILIEGNVYTEYQTYLQNKANENIRYAHVDSVNIFRLIEEILLKPRNNRIHTFERFPDILIWLREQWAGLFGELLQRMTNQQQISTLSNQVETLSVINASLQKYLDALVSKVSPADLPESIQYQHQRLNKFEQSDALKQNKFFKALSNWNVDINQFGVALLTTETFDEFKEKLHKLSNDPERLKPFLSIHNWSSSAQNSINEARIVLGKQPYFPLS